MSTDGLTNAAESDDSQLRVFSVYGASLATAVPFKTALPRGETPWSLEFRAGCQFPSEIQSPVLLHESSVRDPVGVSRLAVSQSSDWTLLRLENRVDFLISSQRIEAVAPEGVADPLVEIGFLGGAMAIWLEKSGVLALHGSAVEVRGSAIGIIGQGGAGKTSLAAAFLRSDHHLVTDDLLAVERIGNHWTAHRGAPQIRLMPEQVRSWFGQERDFEPVHPRLPKLRVPLAPSLGGFAKSSLPLAALLLPQRQQGLKRPELQLLPRPAAVVELVQGSFGPIVMASLGLRGTRLESLGSLAQTVPVARLLMPEGLERLAESVEFVQNWAVSL